MPDLRPVFNVRRAEAAYVEAERKRKEAEAKEVARITSAHARRQQEREDAQRALSSPHSSLREALAWFEDEWTATFPMALHEPFSVEPGDVLGATAWTERWKRWVKAHDLNRDADDPRPYDALRRAHTSLTMSTSLWDRCAAAFLFRLACCAFDPLAAGRNMPDVLPVPYTAGYTEKAIDRLREVVARERTRQPSEARRPEWMDRLDIGKSEAQHKAEEAG